MATERQKPLERFTAQEYEILRNPPQLILVFDNWRGEDPRSMILAERTMAVRAGVAAHIFHSTLYTNDNDRPLVACFAGSHKMDIDDPSGSEPGSTKVKSALEKLQIPPKKIVTRRNTITTTTDLLQLSAFSRAHGIDNIVIVTTDDHINRTKQEVKNVFKRKVNITVVGPSSKVLNSFAVNLNVPDEVRRQIDRLIGIGKFSLPNGGSTELIATLIARIPNRGLRRIVQSAAEKASHPYTPNELARIQEIAKAIQANSAKDKAKFAPIELPPQS